MTNYQKFLALVLLTLIISPFIMAQSQADIFGNNTLNVTYIGVDFSKMKYFGDTGNISRVEMINKFNGINSHTAKGSTLSHLKRAFRKPNMKANIAITTENNQTIDPEKIALFGNIVNKTFNVDTLKQIIQGYTFDSTYSIIALVIVVERLNKINETSKVWFTFIDTRTKEIIFAEMVTGQADGIGFRDHWVNSIYDAVNQIYWHKFMEWKNKLVPDNYVALNISNANAGKAKLKLGSIFGLKFNYCFGNNVHTKSYTNFGLMFNVGLMFQKIVSIDLSYGLQQMATNEKYGPEYNNIFNDNDHQYYLNQLRVGLSVFPLKGKISPFLSGGYGQGFGFFSKNISNGAMFYGEAGIEFRTSSSTKLNLGYLYQYQDLAYDSYNNPNTSIKDKGTLNLSYGGFNLSFLIHF